MIGVDDLFPGIAFHFVRSGAGIFEPATVIPKNISVRRSHPGEMGDVIAESTEAAFVFEQRLLRFFAIGNVVVRNENGNGATLGIAIQRPAGDDENAAAIAAGLNEFALPAAVSF